MGYLAMVSLVLLGLSALFAVTRQIHMFQLNSYFFSRYMGWLKTSPGPRTAGAAVLAAAALAALWMGEEFYLLAVLSALSTAFRIPLAAADYRGAKKKLVFTDRVKRLYFCGFILLAALIVPAALLPPFPARILASAVILLGFATPAFLLLIACINAPVEKSVSHWYVSDAKKILRGMPDLKVIGITGSYGKTSTKYILGRLLSEKYNVVITPESYNTPMGVVRTVRERLKPGTQIFIAEMGAKKSGDIREICDIAAPSMGIITSIGPQHLDTFGSLETIVKTKFELADAVTAAGGTMFLNVDNSYIREHAKNLPAVTYGTSDGSFDFHAENIRYGRSGSSFDIVSENRRIPVSSRLLGVHNVLNILAASAVAAALSLSDEEIRYAVSQLQPVTHRLELKSFLGGAVLIDDAYNANPEGCLEAVRVLGSFDGMKKIIVTPGLVELGEREYDCNYQLGLAAGKTCDIVILVGEKRAVPMADAIGTLDFPKENLHIAKTFSDAMTLLRGICDKSCAVLFENDLPDNYAG